MSWNTGYPRNIGADRYLNELAAGGGGPTGAAGGDLSGTYPAPTVAKLNTRPIVSTAPVNGANLAWDGTNWTPEDVSPYYGTNTATNHGTTCVTIGNAASTAGVTDGVAIGHTATVTDSSVAIGAAATSTGVWSTAIGTSSAAVVGSTAVGEEARANNVAGGCTAVGRGSLASGAQAQAFGYIANATATKSLAVGYNANATAADAIAIGRDSAATNAGDICIGAGVVPVAGSSLNLKGTNAIVAAAAGASDAYWLVSINGVQYKLLLHT